MRLIRLLFILYFITLFTLCAEEINISIATLNFPPLSDQTITNGGFVGELFNSIFEQYGYSVNIKFYPWARGFEMSKNADQVIGLFPSIHTKERETWFYFSDPVMTTNYYLLTRKDTGITTYKDIDEFTDKTIGVLRNGVTGSEIDDGEYTKVEGSDFQTIIKMLLGKRFDLITGEYINISNVINNEFQDKKESIVFIEPPISEIDFYLMISKKNPEAKELLEICNRGIEKIKENGTLDMLIKKYNIKKE